MILATYKKVMADLADVADPAGMEGEVAQELNRDGEPSPSVRSATVCNSLSLFVTTNYSNCRCYQQLPRYDPAVLLVADQARIICHYCRPI